MLDNKYKSEKYYLKIPPNSMTWKKWKYISIFINVSNK